MGSETAPERLVHFRQYGCSTCSRQCDEHERGGGHLLNGFCVIVASCVGVITKWELQWGKPEHSFVKARRAFRKAATLKCLVNGLYGHGSSMLGDLMMKNKRSTVPF